jgi:NAD(P) transhydrogenase subunit beta
VEFLLESRNILYLVSAVLFIFGIKGLTHPRTAVRGNMLGFAGMGLAMVVTLFDWETLSQGWYFWVAGIVVGGGIGYAAAKMVQMTEMPEMVALSAR